MGRGKRVARSNLIGREGEHIFERWALRNGLSAVKADEDIGIDYFCQVLSQVQGSTSLEGTGGVLGVQVKSTAVVNQPSLTLYKIDAEDLLRQKQATCVVGVHLPTEMVHFQFLNRTFLDELLRFVGSSRKTLSLRFDALSSDLDLFRRQLVKLTDPAEQAMLRLHLMQKRLQTAIPHSTVQVELTATGKSYRVDLPWMSSAFSVDPSVRDAVRVAMFQEGFIDPTQQGVRLHPQLEHIFEAGQTSTVTIRGNFQKVERVTIHSGEKTASQPFDFYVFEDEFSFVHRDGLQLTFSRARQNGDRFEHHFEHDLFIPKYPRALKGAALSFFRLFREGASLALGDIVNLDLTQFGEHLIEFGRDLEATLQVFEGLELSRSSFFLHDLKDEEFSRACWILEALFLKSIPLEELTRGFILGPAQEAPLRDLEKPRFSMSVPIALNVKETGVIVWGECLAEGFVYEGQLRGLRILKQHSLSKIEKRPRLTKSQYPELWIHKEWPGIPIGSRENNFPIANSSQSIVAEAIISPAEELESDQEEPQGSAS
jgi:hypothetical protein